MQELEKARKHLDRRLTSLRANERLRMPPRGWVRAIRDSLGMTAGFLAARMGVSRTRITALEQGEVEATVTLASLRRAAEVMNCTLIYALVPNRPLEQIVRDRALFVAQSVIERVDHTMRLENQAVD